MYSVKLINLSVTKIKQEKKDEKETGNQRRQTNVKT